MSESAQLRSLFLDLNAYFASVEQQCRPELRGRPVGVVPFDAETTCCIAASYEAKKNGVTTGTQVREARKLCPGIVFVCSRPAEYVRFHHRIRTAVETCVPIESVFSIDEMSCRLNSDEAEPERAIVLAQRIKRAIREQTGEVLKCSIGLAPNRFLAKVATDMMKPDGLVVIARGDLPRKLHGLKLRDLPGIGENMEARLNRAGIYTVEALCACSEAKLEDVWGGVVGRRFWRWLRGEETALPRTHKQSVGHQHVLPFEMRTAEKARGVAVRLLHKAAARMRHEGYFARGMALDVGLQNRAGWRGMIRLKPLQDTLELVTILAEMWKNCPDGVPVFVGVSLFDLEPADSIAQPLFEEERSALRLNRAMDRINQKFGRNTLRCASMMGYEDSAPGGIAFSSIPDLGLADSAAEERR